MIEIIKDKFIKKQNNFYILTINHKNTKDLITINPFQYEHYNDIDLFNLKIYCDKNNIKLRVLSTMNYLPVNSQYADELILIENRNHMIKAYEKENAVTVLGSCVFNTKEWRGYLEVRFYQVSKNPLERDCYDKTGIIKKIYEEITIEELNKFILEKKVLIRESSLNLFENLELPKEINLAEIKQTFRQLLFCLKKENIVGLDYEFQKSLLEKSKHHYMAIQILSSIKLNWKILAVGGSARLFSMLPTNNILLMARDLYGNDNKIKPNKIGWMETNSLPWKGNQINPNWKLTEEELKNLFLYV